MTVYAIGDVQGCYDTLQALLKKLDFSPSRDRAWILGDLVNRGPKSLEVLRWARQHEGAVRFVLGNHDLHLIARALGLRDVKKRDTLDAVLGASDRDELVGWLRRQPLVAREGDWTLVHAGFVPEWSLAEAERVARGLEAELASDGVRSLLSMRSEGGRVGLADAAPGPARQALALRVLTNLRVCDAIGRIDFSFSEGPAAAPPGLRPWFAWPDRRTSGVRIAFGHWSALGLYRDPEVVGLDTGCVWGLHLTALDLGSGAVFSQAAVEPRRGGE